MNPPRAICTGFLDELVTVLREDGEREPLADILPFVEGCDARFEPRLRAALVSAGAVFGQQVPEHVLGVPFPIGPTIRGRRLDPAAVALLALHDDLALGRLYRETSASCGEGAVTPELAGQLRALVIQCRAAVANGWVVLVVEPA